MKKKLITGLIGGFILMIAVGAYFYQDKGIEIHASEVKKGNINRYIEETGVVKSKKQRTISVNAAGKVSELKFEVGDAVKEGDVLLTLDMDASQFEIKGLESRLNGLLPSYEQAVRNAKNSKTLYEQGALSYDAYQNALSLKQELESQISEIQYSIKQLKEVVEFGEIKAPISGIVTEVFVNTGEQAMNGSPLIEIADLKDLFVEVELLTNEASQISKDASAIVENEDVGFLDDEAKVEKIHPKAYSKISDLGIEQKRVIVEVSTYKDMKQLKLGYEVDVSILAASKKDVMVIPENALFEKNKKSYVYTVEANKAIINEIETGLEGDDTVEIIQGVSEGDMVILSPDENIKDGSKVFISQEE